MIFSHLRWIPTPPPNFLIEFGRITRAIFFNTGGNRPLAPLPPCPLSGATGSSEFPPISYGIQREKKERNTTKMFEFISHLMLGNDTVASEHMGIMRSFSNQTLKKISKNDWFWKPVVCRRGGPREAQPS